MLIHNIDDITIIGPGVDTVLSILYTNFPDKSNCKNPYTGPECNWLKLAYIWLKLFVAFQLVLQ